VWHIWYWYICCYLGKTFITAAELPAIFVSLVIFLCFHLKINERIEYTVSLTYKVLTTSQPDYLHNLISVQSTGRTRSSSLVTLARPPVSSSLQITNRCFTYVSPYLWNQLPSSFRQPHSVYSPPGSPHPAHITSSQSPPSFSSPITPSTFHSRLKTHLFHTSFPLFTLIPSGLPSGILTYTDLKGHCFVCFSFWLRVLD